jgi:RsiW-degrading membrane proteinase PrsW (M82 family)
MSLAWLVRALVGLLPALCFLGALLLLDSYKLVRLRMVVTTIVVGGALAGVCYLLNLAVINAGHVDFENYSRFGAPLVEESIKSVVVLVLIRTRRIGFLVDASVLGYAVGAGFATVENLYYLSTLTDPHMAVWIVRGFGTAILHGGVQAIFAALVLANADRRNGKLDARSIVPPLALAVVIHSAFNQFVLPPIQETLLVLVSIPPLMLWVFMSSEKGVRGWIGSGFDADTELIELLDSGSFSESNAGQYLFALRERFPGEVVADLLCYLRLYVELALRAKGILMMREHGIETVISDDVREKLAEMRYLERSIGPTALRTLQPLMPMSRRDLWQLYMLGS